MLSQNRPENSSVQIKSFSFANVGAEIEFADILIRLIEIFHAKIPGFLAPWKQMRGRVVSTQRLMDQGNEAKFFSHFVILSKEINFYHDYTGSFHLCRCGQDKARSIVVRLPRPGLESGYLPCPAPATHLNAHASFWSTISPLPSSTVGKIGRVLKFLLPFLAGKPFSR